MIQELALAVVLAGAPQSAEVTIYNQGFALVKENRQLSLRAGRQELRIEDVASQIEPTSVAIRSLSAPGSFSVLEQNYQFDLINAMSILNKSVGKKITLNRVLPNGTRERIVGTLMSSPTAVVGGQGGSSMTWNGMVLRTEDGRILLDPSGEVEVNEIPEGMISKPTLMWQVDANKGGSQDVELSYITQGMTWNADYVLSLDNDGKIGDLKGWVTLNNSSGATFKGAKLKLLAGDVIRNRGGRPAGFGGGAPAMDAMKKMEAGFAEEQFADYHLYTLGRPADVRNNEIKQVSLLEAFRIPVAKKLIVDATLAYGYRQPSEGEYGTGALKPQIRIEFENTEENHLGMPLPMGQFKVFQHDSTGSVQLLGEDQIQHTPKKEKLSLVVGRAFDIVAERKRTNFEWIGSSAVGCRETFEIELRNRKDSQETVTVIERPYLEWNVTKKNMEFTKLDSNTIQFVVTLKPNETKKLTYTVEEYWGRSRSGK